MNKTIPQSEAQNRKVKAIMKESDSVAANFLKIIIYEPNINAAEIPDKKVIITPANFPTFS